MKRPFLQLEVGAIKSSANFRRLTFHEKGVWLELILLLHDSDEYGILRWPLKDIAAAINCTEQDLKSLINKAVLKGKDDEKEEVSFSTSISQKNRPPRDEVLIDKQRGPLWYSSKLVRDEHIRKSKSIHGVKSLLNPNVPPRKGIHILKDKVSSSPSSSFTTVNNKQSIKENIPSEYKRKNKRPLPPDLTISDANREVANAHGLDVALEFEQFKARNIAKGMQYVNWEAAFRNWLHQSHKYKTQNQANGGKPYVRPENPSARYFRQNQEALAAAEAAEAAFDCDFEIVHKIAGPLPAQVD